MIELKNISKSFKQKNKEIKALSTTNLFIEEGEIFGIVGYSGAGKSTLLRCINLLEEPTTGDVVVDGKIVNNLSRNELRLYRQKVGMIFQQFNLLYSKTVSENIAFNLKAGGVDKDKIEQRIDELLALVGLSDKKNVYPKQLSGGQKQRVGIAKALANNPKVLLCDEATSALDPVTTKQILELLKKINEKFKLTIVLVTHEMDVIKQVCDRVAVMEKGKIIELNEVYEVFANPQTSLMKEFIDNLHNDDHVESNIVKKENVTTVKVVFKGGLSEEPVIQSVANRFNLLVNILSGRIEYIHGKPLGNLIISLEGEEEERNYFVEYINKEIKGVEVSIYG